MDLLAGWTVAVTADRRAAEQADLLQRRGAEVLLLPTVITSSADDVAAEAGTRSILTGTVDHVVVTTGIGLRSWVAMAWSWGLGDALLDCLATTPVWARGAKAVGALVGEGLDRAARDAGETLAEVLEALLANGVAGTRIGVQCHGSDQRWFLDELIAAGAEVVAVPVYRTTPAPAASVMERLATATADGQLDAITFTSPISVAAVAEDPILVGLLRASDVVSACVGPLTAAAAADAGLTRLVVPETHRMGSMLRALGEHMDARATTFAVGDVRVRHQGSRVAVDDTVVRLTPRERRLLEAMLRIPGAVLSKERLASTAWDEPVDTHTVEVTVNRLRRKLGIAAAAVETSNRRGYRIAV